MTIMSAPRAGRTDAPPNGAHVAMTATRKNRRPLVFTGDPNGQYVAALLASGWSVTTLAGRAVTR
ncbi:MAG: hypothetical protein JXA67_00085 [Micromonosporaceae bacterium]|nr:hypothetical protein [Micromonosporaceae bacterium]